MNTRKSTWLKLFCIALIPLLFTVGCAKRDAQKAMTLAQAAQEEARAAKAIGYAPKAWDDADRLFKQAQSQFDAGSYKESIDLYSQAEGRFRSAVETAREREPIIRALVEKIDGALSSATENMDKSRAGGVLTADDLAPVQTILDSLTQRMESEIRDEYNEEKLNAFLAEVEQAVVRTDSLALAHLKPQANTAKQDIQNLITRVQELKGDVHAPDQYAQVLVKFQEIETADQEGHWQSVMDLSAELTEPLNDIIQIAQEKAAGDILRQVSAQVAQAKQMDVQGIDAFTAAVQRAETTLQSGQAALQSQDYSSAIAATDQAKAALKEAFQSLGQQSQQNIDTAKAHLQSAIEQEADKYAKSVVSQVNEAIAGAEELLKAENFAKAYSTSQIALKVSGQAVDAARRGKAQLALNEAEQPFSILHGQGGAQYAGDAYKEAMAQVQALREKMKNGEFETVVTESPEAAKVVQSALGALEESSSEYIVKADQALEAAKAAGASEWVGIQFANASNLRSSAEKNQQSKKFLTSIQNSEAAIKTAKDAESKAYQLQSEQNLRKSDEFITVAKRAEQDRLSPLAYRQALESREESVRLLQQQEYKKAFENSNVTLQKSDRALNNLVMTAKEKTDSALEAEAMKYSEAEINQALTYLTKAEEAQRAQNFTSANELAIESAKLAEAAEHFTWKQRSYKLLMDLEGAKAELENHLAPIKTPALYEKVITSLAEARVLQIDQDYKNSYVYADQADEAKKAAWDSMQAELNQTLQELKETADWMGENAKDPEGREIKMALLNSIPELETNMALRDWKSAYAAEEKCLKVANRVRVRFEQRNRSLMAKELQAQIHPYQKQGVLSILPEQKEQLQDTFKSLKKPGAEETYSEVNQKFLDTTQEVENLPTTIVTKAKVHTEEIATTLQQAEVAGASKYYKDWYRDLSSDLQMLRNAVQGENFGEITTYLRKLDREAPRLLVASQKAAEEDEYLKEIEKNLNQMNNVFQELGFLGTLPKGVMAVARLTEYKLDETVQDMFQALQGTMSVGTLLVNAELLEENIINLKPPKTMARIHRKALESSKLFRLAAEAFVIYGESKAHDVNYREECLANGYERLSKSLKINEVLLFEINEARKMTGTDKFLRGIKHIEKNLADFYYNYSGY